MRLLAVNLSSLPYEGPTSKIGRLRDVKFLTDASDGDAVQVWSGGVVEAFDRLAERFAAELERLVVHRNEHWAGSAQGAKRSWWLTPRSIECLR